MFTLKAAEKDKEGRRLENLATANGISMDAAVAAVLSESLAGVFLGIIDLLQEINQIFSVMNILMNLWVFISTLHTHCFFLPQMDT